MEVGAATTAASEVKIVDSDKIGFAGLGADDFMKLLLAQLQNQDPSEPTSNAELLNQLSSMRSLAANIELSETIEDITANQQLTSAANFLGTLVTGNNLDNKEVTGIVDRAIQREGKVFLGIGDDEILVENVSQLNFVFPGNTG